MSKLIKPHGGGDLKPLMLTGEELANGPIRAESMPSIRLSSREKGDLIMLGMGGFTPLTGFMGHDDWHGVCRDMRLSNGTFWPIPVTLSTSQHAADGLKIGQEIALIDPDSDITMGIMTLEEKYTIDKSFECLEVFRTKSEDHPGVQMVMNQGEVNLAGPVKVISHGDFPEKYGSFFMSPAETRAAFVEKGWTDVAAFQTRNPMHRSHEFLAKLAIEVCDGVLVHSLLGKLKPGDIPAEVRVNAIDKLINNYFVPNTVIQAGYPLDMRYAGPREALLHALFRQNYGCSRLIVGRDHAGVGDFYGAFDAQKIFDEIPKGSLLIEPLKFDWTFWCDACKSMASMKTCPHSADDRLLLSGSKLRNLLSTDSEIPDNFSRPEVLAILKEYYRNLAKDDRVVIKLTGASAA